MESRIFRANELTQGEIAQILDFMEAIMARRQESRESDTPSKCEYQDELHWHCMLCGNCWGGWTKINPSAPPTCSKCHKPNWNKCPVNGPHNKDCEECQVIIKRQVKELDDLEFIRKYLK